MQEFYFTVHSIFKKLVLEARSIQSLKDFLIFLPAQIGDQTGQMTAQMNLADLKDVLGISDKTG